MDADSTDDRLLAALPIVERILGFIRRRNHLSADEAEDVASYVRLKLVERAPTIFGQFRGRSTLETYLGVVVQRLFLDYRGEKRSRSRHPDPSRMPPTAGGIGHSADDPVARGEDRAAAGRMEAALQLAMSALPDQERLIVRMHFIEGVSLASVAALIGVPAKPLYRRVEQILGKLRMALESAGIASRDVRDLIGRREFGIGWPAEPAGELGNGAGEPSKEG